MAKKATETKAAETVGSAEPVGTTEPQYVAVRPCAIDRGSFSEFFPPGAVIVDATPDHIATLLAHGAIVFASPPTDEVETASEGDAAPNSESGVTPNPEV